jgi:hypothetical protein
VKVCEYLRMVQVLFSFRHFAMSSVGASLLAKAQCQQMNVCLEERIREQAHSYIGTGVLSSF